MGGRQRLITTGLADAVAAARAAADGKDVALMGGVVVTEALTAGLVDELILHQVPVLLGSGRPYFHSLPEHIQLQLVTAAELELGVLCANDTDTRARRLATLAQVRATYPLLPLDAETASCFARIAAGELEAGRRIRRHDAWIAATALRHGVAVATQDADVPTFAAVTVLRV